MGDSLRNALKKAFAGKKGGSPDKKKSSRGENPAEGGSMARDKFHDPDSLFTTEQINGADSFSALMEQLGIEPMNNNNAGPDSSRAPHVSRKKNETRHGYKIRKHVPGKSHEKCPTTSKSATSTEIDQKAIRMNAAKSKSSRTIAKRRLVPSRQRQRGTTSRARKAIDPAPAYLVDIRGPVVPHPYLTRISGETRRPMLYSNSIDQIVESIITDEREVNIGLDFGTSSVKVVIGDNSLNKAFAVPFFEGTGLESFLLPSRIWRKNHVFTLNEGNCAFRNLKLRLTQDKCSMNDFSAAAAFLALVVRHARTWLFEQHGDIYRQTKIAWKLTLGLPAENYNNEPLVTIFKKLAAASWRLSLVDGDQIPESSVREICTDVWKEPFDTVHAAPDLAMIDFDVVPELSAQVYGFLTSTKFDPNARNIFMIVDVGAGTIDSSIFHVKRERAKRLSFEYYANFVEFNGVANLHAARMKWYRSLGRKKHLGPEFETVLKQVGTPSDFTGAIPESICDYFEGIDITFSSPETSPDDMFFKDRVKAQVLARTLKKARNGVENYQAFSGMPVFVCGGGSRMEYYKKLEKHLLSHPNASWFRFKPRRLEVPDILEAPGVMKNDFDRLSVAFGLSFVQVAQCVKKTTPPPPPVISSTNPPCPGCGSRTICYCS